jgi:hypothetical protein
MFRKGNIGFAVAAVILGSVPAGAADLGFQLHAIVPVQCEVRHQAIGGGTAVTGTVALGELDEFCNAPGGYEVIVSYTPGTMQGAILSAGEDSVTLNGSGEATLSRVPGPRIRARALVATPGANGFDTDRLEVTIRPA